MKLIVTSDRRITRSDIFFFEKNGDKKKSIFSPVFRDSYNCGQTLHILNKSDKFHWFLLIKLGIRTFLLIISYRYRLPQNSVIGSNSHYRASLILAQTPAGFHTFWSIWIKCVFSLKGLQPTFGSTPQLRTTPSVKWKYPRCGPSALTPYSINAQPCISFQQLHLSDVTSFQNLVLNWDRDNHRNHGNHELTLFISSLGMAMWSKKWHTAQCVCGKSEPEFDDDKKLKSTLFSQL